MNVGKRNVACVGSVALACYAVCIGWPVGARAEGPAKQADAGATGVKAGGASSLDEALLKDLDNELLDGVHDLPALPVEPRPAAGSAERTDRPAEEDSPGQSPRPAAAGVDSGGDSAAERQSLATDSIGLAATDPLARIGEKMRQAKSLIDDRKAVEKTRLVQTQIVEDLAALIKKLEQQSQSASSSSGQSKSGDPAQETGPRSPVAQPKSGAGKGGQPKDGPVKDSTERLVKHDARRPDAEQQKDLMKDVWGRLPDHAREQLMQSSPEQFLPKYEQLIEQYYKRLAEQQNAKP